MTIAGAIKIMFNTLLSREKLYCVIAEVTAVDNTKRTCTVSPIDGSPDLYDIRMTSEISTTGGLTDGFCIFPNIGSFVLVAFVNKTTGIIVNSNTPSQIFSDTQLFQFNQGKNLGLIKIVKLTEKLNKLVSEVNGLISKYNSHVHVINGAIPAAPPTPVTSSPTIATSTNTTSFLKDDYEDKLVTH